MKSRGIFMWKGTNCSCPEIVALLFKSSSVSFLACVHGISDSVFFLQAHVCGSHAVFRRSDKHQSSTYITKFFNLVVDFVLHFVFWYFVSGFYWNTKDFFSNNNAFGILCLNEVFTCCDCYFCCLWLKLCGTNFTQASLFPRSLWMFWLMCSWFSVSFRAIWQCHN